MKWLMPFVGVMIPAYVISRAAGLIGTQIGLVLICTAINMPIVIWTLYSFMRDIPREILDSARIDGASVMRQIVFLLPPLCGPGLGSAALLSIILCWNEAFWSFQMTPAEGSPFSAVIATLSGAPLPAEISAASLIAIAPILLIAWLTHRQSRGLTFGVVH